MAKFIYKILRQDEWQAATKAEAYSGSPDDMRDGFIHFSTRDQLTGTLEKYFSGEAKIILLAYDPKGFENQLKWEASRGGELFPHLYAPLNVQNAAHTVPLQKSALSTFDLSPLSDMDQA